MGLVLLKREGSIYITVTRGYNTPQKWSSEKDVLRRGLIISMIPITTYVTISRVTNTLFSTSYVCS